MLGLQPLDLVHGLEGSLARVEADRKADGTLGRPVFQKAKQPLFPHRLDVDSGFGKDEHRVTLGLEIFGEGKLDERRGELNPFRGSPLDKGVGPQGFKVASSIKFLLIGKSLRLLQRNRRPYLFEMPFGFRE